MKVVNFELPPSINNIDQFLNSTFFRNKLESSFRSQLTSVRERQNSDRVQPLLIKKPQIVITAGGGFNL